MKAPDKIYVPIVNLGIEEGEHPAPLWWNKDKKSEHPDVVGTIEYIRKDALLEWANGKMTIEGATEGIVGGYDLAMKDLIEHIEKVSSKPKQVRTLEKEFDGYNSIVITLDKYVLEGIGIHRGNKVIIKIQRKED